MGYMRRVETAQGRKGFVQDIRVEVELKELLNKLLLLNFLY